MDNALTDPRVAAEEFPFDRPVLGSEITGIMTYNVQAPGWTSARADIGADIIRLQNADLIGLQEAGNVQQGDLFDRLDDVYELETFAGGATSSPVLLKKGVFAIIDSGSSTVTPGCNNQGFVNYLVVEHRASAERLIVHNNHFCAMIINFPAGEPTAEERNEAHAAALIDTIIDNLATWRAPVIALGDLNTAITSDTMQFLLQQAPLEGGTANPIALYDSWDSAFPGVPKPARIDWILTTDIGLRVLGAAVISDAQTAMASDHEPVLTTLAVDTTAVSAASSLDVEAPTEPTSLQSTTVGDTTVSLRWAASSDDVGVTAYRIRRDSVLLATSAALVFDDSGLQPTTSYLYSVTALDAGGNESPASEITVTTAATPVNVPPTTGGGGSGGGGSLGICVLLLLGARYAKEQLPVPR